MPRCSIFGADRCTYDGVVSKMGLQAMTTMGFSERDMDDVKQLITETSLRMLALTYVISFVRPPKKNQNKL